MPRILGVNIPKEKIILVSLTHIYGIGSATAKKIISSVGMCQQTRTHSISDSDLSRLSVEAKKYIVEGDLRRKIRTDIKLLKDLKTYRGKRHALKLPTRGQRTKTNARTAKKNKIG